MAIVAMLNVYTKGKLASNVKLLCSDDINATLRIGRTRQDV